MVISTTEAANKKVPSRAISSPSRRRDRNEREPARGPAPGTVVVVVATLIGSGPELSFPWRRPPWEAARRIELRRNSVRPQDRKSTRLNSSHLVISYAVFCLKKKNKK